MTPKRKREKHGMHGTPEYRTWQGLKDRCLNEKSRAYAMYGGRGITVCDRWAESFWNFFQDMGEKPEGWSLDRIDNDGPYSPNNCRWATPLEQARNKRWNVILTFAGKSQCIIEWAEETGIHHQTLLSRIEYGWTTEEILMTPAGKSRRPSISSIQDAISKYYGVSVLEMSSESRFKEICMPRHIAMYLARKLGHHSLPKIGRMFGGRDHSSVMHAVSRIENLVQREDGLMAEIQRICAALEREAR